MTDRDRWVTTAERTADWPLELAVLQMPAAAASPALAGVTSQASSAARTETPTSNNGDSEDHRAAPERSSTAQKRKAESQSEQAGSTSGIGRQAPEVKKIRFTGASATGQANSSPANQTLPSPATPPAQSTAPESAPAMPSRASSSNDADFKIGDPVLVHLKAYPPWPAKVECYPNIV